MDQLNTSWRHIGVIDDVGDISVHEHLARQQPDARRRCNAAVRAAYPKILGRLDLRQFLKKSGSLSLMLVLQKPARSKGVEPNLRERPYSVRASAFKIRSMASQAPAEPCSAFTISLAVSAFVR